MAKFNFNEALERLNDEQSINARDVQARALQRFVWVAEWHLPGCLSESFSILTTKRDAIECALSMAEGSDGPPRGMRADLQRFGRSDRTHTEAWAPGAITTIERRRLSSFF